MAILQSEAYIAAVGSMDSAVSLLLQPIKCSSMAFAAVLGVALSVMSIVSRRTHKLSLDDVDNPLNCAQDLQIEQGILDFTSPPVRLIVGILIQKDAERVPRALNTEPYTSAIKASYIHSTVAYGCSREALYSHLGFILPTRAFIILIRKGSWGLVTYIDSTLPSSCSSSSQENAFELLSATFITSREIFATRSEYLRVAASHRVKCALRL